MNSSQPIDKKKFGKVCVQKLGLLMSDVVVDWCGFQSGDKFLLTRNNKIKYEI